MDLKIRQNFASFLICYGSGWFLVCCNFIQYALENGVLTSCGNLMKISELILTTFLAPPSSCRGLAAQLERNDVVMGCDNISKGIPLILVSLFHFSPCPSSHRNSQLGQILNCAIACRHGSEYSMKKINLSFTTTSFQHIVSLKYVSTLPSILCNQIKCDFTQISGSK